jgi:hypothetical protein
MIREDIFSKMQTGDYALIAEKTGRRPSTVRAQLSGYRTLKDDVRLAAMEIISIREKVKSEFLNIK